MKKKQSKKKKKGALDKQRWQAHVCFFPWSQMWHQQWKLNKISVTMLIRVLRIFIHTSGSAHSQLLLQIMYIQFIFEKCNFILQRQVSFLLFLCMTIISGMSERWEKKTHKTYRASLLRQKTQSWASNVEQWDSYIQTCISKQITTLGQITQDLAI